MDLDDLHGDSHGYFVPMVDMLAGVVFILVILLAAGALVSRSDFAAHDRMQKEVQQIDAQLKEAKREQRLYLEPRHIARLAMLELLKRMQARLATAGFQATLDPDQGEIRVTADAYAPDATSLTPDGNRIAKAVGDVLITETPCLVARHGAAPPACKVYRGARLEDVTIFAAGSTASTASSLTEARALQLMTAVAVTHPQLLAEKADDGERLLGSDAQTANGAPQPPQQGAADRDDVVGVKVTMAVPRIPAHPGQAEKKHPRG